MRNRNVLLALVAVLACGLIAAGCGGDDDDSTDGGATSAVEDTAVPTTPEEAQDQAEQALEDAPENIDEAVQQCLDNVDSSGLSDQQKENLKKLCESGGDAANDALKNAEDLQDSLGN